MRPATTEPDEPAPNMPASGRGCSLCSDDATGYRWFARVKMRAGSWLPVCDMHRNRSGVPVTWRSADCDN